MNRLIDWLKNVLSEANGTPSSIRVSLLVVVASVIGLLIYVVVRHVLDHSVMDVGPNLANLLSVSIGSLSAAKLGSKFGEAPPQS